MGKARNAIQIVDEQPVYIPLLKNKDFCAEWVQILIRSSLDYTRAAGLETLAVRINEDLLWMIVCKIEKREVYYEVFHSTVEETDAGLQLKEARELDELKRAAIAAYWILKYHPLSYGAQAADSIDISCLNQGFAQFFILSALLAVADEANKRFEVTERLRKDLQYALCNWSLSREALMLLVDSLGEQIINQPS